LYSEFSVLKLYAAFSRQLKSPLQIAVHHRKKDTATGFIATVVCSTETSKCGQTLCPLSKN